MYVYFLCFFFSSRRRHTRCGRDWSSDVCSSDLHASQHMHDQQEYEAGFGELHQRLIAPAQEAVELRLAVDGEAEREEMQRQEDGERQAGEAVYQRREPE